MFWYHKTGIISRGEAWEDDLCVINQMSKGKNEQIEKRDLCEEYWCLVAASNSYYSSHIIDQTRSVLKRDVCIAALYCSMCILSH